MNKKQLIVLSLILLCIIFSSCSSYKNRYEIAGFENNGKAVEPFAKEFKKAVIKKDKEKVASMINYPVEAEFKKKTVTINNAKEFIRLYDSVFNKDLVRIIANANTHNMFANWKGVMLDKDGAVWFGTNGKDIKVIAVGVYHMPKSVWDFQNE